MTSEDPAAFEWETLDLDAPYPEPVYRAVNTAGDVATISRYIADRDGKKYDRGPGENWTLTFMPGGYAGVVDYCRTLDDAKSAAAKYSRILRTGQLLCAEQGDKRKENQ
jgi:hypothetical protein